MMEAYLCSVSAATKRRLRRSPGGKVSNASGDSETFGAYRRTGMVVDLMLLI